MLRASSARPAMFRWLGAAVIMALLIAACGGDTTDDGGGGSPTTGEEGAGDGADSAEEETVDVRVAMPASLTGAAAFVGVPATQAFKLAIEEGNESGELGNLRIVLEEEDVASDPNQALTVVESFASDSSIVMIAGPTGSGESASVGPIAQEAGVTLMPIPAKAEGIAEAGDYVFQVGGQPGITEPAPIEAAVSDYGIEDVVIIYARDNAAQVDQASLANELFTELGANVVDQIEVASDDTNFGALVTRAMANDPDAVYITLYAEQAGGLVSQAQQAGVDDDELFVATSTSASDALWETGGSAVEGMLFDADYDPGLDTDLNRSFRDAYSERYNSAPDNWAAVGYSAGLIVRAAFESLAGDDVTREAVRDAMASLSDVEVVLGSGVFNFDEEGRAQYDGAVLLAEDGGFVAYEGP